MILPRATVSVTYKKSEAWYCIHSQPKHEHIAATSLRNIHGVESFCPRLRFRKATRRGPVWFTEAMFPGYFFAYFEYAAMHRVVRYAHGVSTIVHFGNRVPKLDNTVILTLREQCAKSGNETIVIEPPLERGSQVKIAAGSFLGLETIITRVIPARERVCVLLDFLGKQVEMELSSSAVVLTDPLSTI